MDAAPPTNSVPPPAAPSPGSGPPPLVQQTISAPQHPAQTSTSVSAVWPRSAQLATAFLLGLATAMLGIQMWSMSRWSTRPLDRNREQTTRYRIDLNLADREQLLQVPGIGDRTADKIEAFRHKQGPFRSKKELNEVYGICPAKYEKMGDWLTVQ